MQVIYGKNVKNRCLPYAPALCGEGDAWVEEPEDFKRSWLSVVDGCCESLSDY